MSNFRKLSKTEYKDLFDKASFKTFFHNPEWHEFLEKEFKWLKFEYYSYKKDEAILPLAQFKVFGKEKLVSLPFCEYGGPLRLGEVNIDEFNKDVLTDFGESIKIKIWPQVFESSGISSSIASFASSHWRRDLEDTSERELWNSLRKTLRQEIDNAHKHNLKVRKCKSERDLKKFYNLYVANLRRKKTIPYPWQLIQFLYKNAPSELLLVFSEDKIIGGAFFLNYSVFAHYFLSATDYKYRNLGAAHLILWEKIRSLIGKDVIFDLGASPQGSPLEIFKRGWGGTEMPIYQIGIKKSEENLRSSKLRNIWGLLPNFVIKKLSPRLIKYRL